MPKHDPADSKQEAKNANFPAEGIATKNGSRAPENMTEYEKQRMKRIEENKERMRAMGLDKMASSFMGSIPISKNTKNKGKRKADLEDDEEYKPPIKDEISSSSSESDDDDDDEYCVSRAKGKKSTPNPKTSKISGSAEFVDDDDALMKAIALSLQDSPGCLDVANKTPSQTPDAKALSAKSTERKPIARKDDTGKRKKKNLFSSRVQMTEDELIIHFFQFDETSKGGINLRDLRRVAFSHDFTWTDEELAHMIHLFDTDGNGKLSLNDFTKIVERCNMRQLSENAEKDSEA